MATWNPRANDVFLKALDVPTPNERRALVERECAGDPELRADVESLLEANARADSFLDSPAARPDETPTADAPALAEGPGTVIGPYKLLEPIGEGGFGVVFLAEQTGPVRRKVALKVLKPGMDTRQVVARFEAERQALAIMDHPNIAKVFDGGATHLGRPYFVMELVKGVPINEFCDEHHLTPRQRLELFLAVCSAVQHAHHKGIIHRDLKPSNVLVSRHDSTPVAKVIDFGVAKALGQGLTDKTLFTGVAQMVGTPLYMSPEQAGMSDLDVDTRSDIYSLGVLLYELLTSTTPFTRERFREATPDEIRRIIREEEPPRPSTRLLASQETLRSIAARRQTEPAKLTKLMHGELDWVVMKALEKDRNRRYETANAFALDVQRYLADEPVQACPPSRWYRLRKLIRRRRSAAVSVIIALGALVVVLVSLAVSTAWAVRKQEQTETALRLAHAEHQRAVSHAAEADKQSRRADDNFRWAIEEVGELLRLADGEDLSGPHVDRLRRDQAKRAIPFFQEMLTQKRTDLEGRRQTALAYLGLARALAAGHDLLQVADAYGAALTYSRDLARDFPEQPSFAKQVDAIRLSLGRLVGSAQGNADRLIAAGKLNEGMTAYRDTLVIFDKFSAEMANPEMYAMAAGHAANRLARLLRGAGQDGEAQQVASKADAIWQKLQSDAPRNIWLPICNVMDGEVLFLRGLLRAAAGRIAEAEADYRKVLTSFDGMTAKDRAAAMDLEIIDFADVHEALGALLWASDRRDKATQQFRQAEQERLAQTKSVYRDNLMAWFWVSCPDPQFLRITAAVDLARKAVEQKPAVAEYWTTLGVASYRAGNWQAAVDALQKAEEARGKDWRPRLHQDVRISWFFRAMGYWQLGEKEKALQWYHQAATAMDKRDPNNAELRRFRAEAQSLLRIPEPTRAKRD